MSGKTANALEILKRRYIGTDKRRQEALKRELVNAKVASLIYDARKRAGLNQGQLANLIGTTQSVISRMEDSDYGGHTLRILNRIAEALNTSLEVRFSPEGLPLAEPTITPGYSNEVLMQCPAMQMKDRGWLDSLETPNDLMIQLRFFLGICPKLAAANFRQSKPDKANEAAMMCWLTKLEIEAERIDVSRFTKRRLKQELPDLVHLSARDDGPVKAVEWLEDRGVRCIFIKHFPKTYLDGAAMLLDDGKPSVGLSLRHDRLDSFWFTLLHEIGHILLHQKELLSNPIVDEEVEKDSNEIHEAQADRFAGNAWVSPNAWKQFRRKTGNYLRLSDIKGFAADLGVTQALVAGRLRRELKRWRHYKDLLGEGTVRSTLEKKYRIF